MNIATGFDVEPLSDGSVLIEFFGDDGKTLNKQAITAEALTRMSVVTVLIDIAMKQGPKAVEILCKELNKNRQEART